MAMRYFVFLLFVSVASFAQTPAKDIQIKLAQLAAPDELREKATVYGFDDKGEIIVLKKGENEMICLADDPKQEGLNVSCYHKDLEPFMARGRELKKEGKSFQEVFDIREKEVKEGKFKMPKAPSTLYVYSAKDEQVDKTNGEVKDGYLRYVIYIPYATAATTGLPLKPTAPGMPWIMDPGTHRAHIM